MIHKEQSMNKCKFFKKKFIKSTFFLNELWFRKLSSNYE